MVSFAKFLVTVVLTIIISGSSALAQDAQTTKALHDLFTREWDYDLRESPTRASQLGDRRWNDRWSDISLEAIKRRHNHERQVLTELEKIDRSKLARSEQLNYDLFRKASEQAIEEFQYRWYLVPLNQRGGIQSQNELADSLRFTTVKDYEDWIARLKTFPTFMDQTIALMREGIRAKMLLPEVIMQRIPAQIDRQIFNNADQSPFYKPFKRFPSSVPVADQERLMKEALATIGSDIIPSYRNFKKFFTEEYLPASFKEVGAWQMPEGGAMYAFLVRKYTTTNTTPEEVHARGLSEVKRIRAAMQEVMNQVGFKGTLSEFFAFLRTDKRFYYNTPEELFAAYQAISKRIDPHLVKVFKTLPRMPYGVEPIPSAIAPDTTTAYYRQPAADGSRAGTYFVNLFQPLSRPKWEMMALSLHEAVPGHHLQIALAQEQGDIPNFRRYGGYTAFVEGWGLYAESLGEDMGLYDDPYAKFGQLAYEMWRAVRLVVDTGIHQMHWTRKQAIDYFMENCPKQELDIINEIDRYIAWPGQALAYKTGELKIKELRERSSRELGTRFDVREFHEVVLGSGAVPLDILERNVVEWIEGKKKS